MRASKGRKGIRTKRVWNSQKGFCIWCGKKTWLRGQPKDIVHKVSGAIPGAHGARKAMRRAMATSEHVKPRSLEMRNVDQVIVMACQVCNSRRGNDVHAFRPDPKVLLRLSPSERGRICTILQFGLIQKRS